MKAVSQCDKSRNSCCNDNKGPVSIPASSCSPPTTIELRGIPIHFPFKPYDCQSVYMGKVIDALLRCENALLESPTGTGKTLCLLCAALAWQREQIKSLSSSLFLSSSQSSSAFTDDLTGIATTTTSVTTSSRATMNGTSTRTSGSSSTTGAKRRRPPTIIYASRTHSQLSQVVRELKNTRYRPKHAILGSREQMCVNKKVKKENNKSSASDINHDCNNLAKERKCFYRNNLEGFVPPQNERQSHTGNSTTITQQQPIMDMEDLVSMGKKHKVCPFYYTRSLLEEAELIFMPYNYLFDKESRNTTLSDIPWNDSVLIFDEAHNLESFATDSASFDLSNADLRACVNEVNRGIHYLQLLQQTDNPTNNNNLTLDDAVKLKALLLHLDAYILDLNANHYSTAKGNANSITTTTTSANGTANGAGGAYSGEYMMDIFKKGASINFANHQLFIDKVREVSDLLMDMRSSSSSSSSSTIIKGAPQLEHLVTCIKRVFGESTEARCLAKANSYRVYITPKTKQHNSNNNPQQKSSSASSTSSSTSNMTTRTVSYWCFAPSLAMQELTNLNVRSIIITSGTLSPLPSYSMELGIPFPKQNILENPHIIEKQQIHVRVVGKGVSGKHLTSSYERRKDGEYYTELGNTLCTLAKLIPDGILIFFPSYSVMETCLERWGGPMIAANANNYDNLLFKNNNNHNKRFHSKQHFFAARRNTKQRSRTDRCSFPCTAGTDGNTTTSTANSSNNGASSLPWKRLLNIKSIVIEPKSTSNLQEAISDFHRFLNMPKSKGCILMGVCRGKISEGIDFAHKMSRAVIITGLPFPPAFDPKVKLKREYLDSIKLNNSRIAGEKIAGGGFGFGFGVTTTARVAGSSSYTNNNKTNSNNNNNSNTNSTYTTASNTINNNISGHEWYTQQAHRAVNQAIGRVIRNKSDYGAILLLDSRFGESRNHSGLSKWVRPHLQKDEGMGITIRSLVQFFKGAAAAVEQQQKASAFAARTIISIKKKKGIVLEYEKEVDYDDEDGENFTKVAVIRKDNNNNQCSELATSTMSMPTTCFTAAAAVAKEEDSSCTNKINDKKMKANGNNNNDKDDNNNNTCFIPPELVIARLDVKTMQQKHQQRQKQQETNASSSYNNKDPQHEISGNTTNTRNNKNNKSSFDAFFSSNNKEVIRSSSTSVVTITKKNIDINSSSSSSNGNNSKNNNNNKTNANNSYCKTPTTTATLIKTSPSPSKENAMQFFKTAQSLFSSTELSSIRKAVVSMKAHGESKNMGSYLNSACDIVKIIIRYETFHSVSSSSSSSNCNSSYSSSSSNSSNPSRSVMNQQQHSSNATEGKKKRKSILFMFFLLLPEDYRRDVELTSMRLIYDKSKLAGLCGKIHTSYQNFSLMTMRSRVSKLLCELWCDSEKVVKHDKRKIGNNAAAATSTKNNTAIKLLSKADYVSRVQALLKEVQGVGVVDNKTGVDSNNIRRTTSTTTAGKNNFTKSNENNKDVVCSFVHAFCKLIPPNFVGATYALAEETIASNHVSHMKKMDADRSGEKRVESIRFLDGPPLRHRIKSENIVNGNKNNNNKNNNNNSNTTTKITTTNPKHSVGVRRGVISSSSSSSLITTTTKTIAKTPQNTVVTPNTVNATKSNHIADNEEQRELSQLAPYKRIKQAPLNNENTACNATALSIQRKRSQDEVLQDKSNLILSSSSSPPQPPPPQILKNGNNLPLSSPTITLVQAAAVTGAGTTAATTTLVSKPATPESAGLVRRLLSSASKKNDSDRPAKIAKRTPSSSIEKAPSYKRSSDPFANVIFEAESKTFIKKRKSSASDIARKLNSNAPKNVICTICERTLRKPLMGDCGHVACKSCWVEWLKRSQSCPVCRAATKKQNLSLLVYERRPGSGAPTTLSQICNDAENDHDSDQEDESKP